MNEAYIPMKRVMSSCVTVEYDLFGEICDHEQYGELRDDLSRANPNDVFILNINSGGGDLEVGIMLVKSIQSSNATVISRVVFPSASMAALIAISGDALIMDENTELMFHSYSGIGSIDSKSHEMIETTLGMHKHFSGMFNKIMGKFLTKNEIKAMWEGKDIRVSWDDGDLQNRIKRHFK